MDRYEIFDFCEHAYDVEPEYLWVRHPRYAVLRNASSRKWFALIMNISAAKIGSDSNNEIDIINLKCEPEKVPDLLSMTGITTGYHMRKNGWISVDIRMFQDDFLIPLIKGSFNLTEKGRKINRKQ